MKAVSTLIGICFVLMGLLFAVPGQITAQEPPEVDSAQANGVPVSTQALIQQASDPVVAIDYDGDRVLIWKNEATNFLEGQTYMADGSPRGNVFQVNDADSAAASYDVAMDADGDFVVAWRGGDGLEQIYAQRYSINGSPRGSRINVVENDLSADPRLGIYGQVTVAMNGLGDFVVAWPYCLLSVPQTGGIKAQRYSRFGSSLGAKFDITDDGRCFSGQPDIAMDENGNFAAVWVDPGPYANILIRRFDSDDSPLDEDPQLVCDGLILVGGNLHPVDCESPAIAAADSGFSYVIAYLEDGDLQYRRYLSSLRNSRTVVFSFGVNNLAHPDVSVDYKGDFVISFRNENGGRYSILTARYSADGINKGRTNTVASSGSLNLDNPAVAVDSGGNFVVAWEQNGDVATQNYEPEDADPPVDPPKELKVFLPVILK